MPGRIDRKVKIIGAASAAAALAAGLVAYQVQSPGPSPAASKTSAYQQRAAASARASAKAKDAASTDATAARREAAQKAKARSAAGKRTAKPAAKPAPKPAHKAAAKPAVRAVARKPRPACVGNAAGGLLPQNYAAIVDFLSAHGYTRIAAAGIAGNIFRESLGNPESVGTGGGGLIGWTPLPAGFVTGNIAADLHTQLLALLTYNQQWAQYIPMLNAAKSAAGAAYVYMAYFERPGLPATAQREGAAVAVAQACGIG